MRSKNTVRFILGAFFLFNILFAVAAAAQQGSVYFSVGYNKTWFTKSTIHIEQSELGNSYDMLKVKGDNKTGAAISALKLNYHLGFYFDDEQKIGLEASFDPVNYQVTDNQNINIKGMVNGMFNVNRTVNISKAKGSYYMYDGANMFLLSFVRRFGIYRANTNNIGFDAITKVGFGPAFPSFNSSLPVHPVATGMQFGGWNAGAEAGFRVSVYRRAYFEFVGKYDYAVFDNMRIDDGSASHKFGSYEIMASFGITLPTNRLNPLFRHEHRIVTMLPFFMHKDEVGEEIKAKKVKEVLEGDDNAGIKPLDEVPEFGSILDKNRRGEDTLGLDSLARRDSLAMIAEEEAARRDKKRFRKEEDQHIVLDSMGNIISQDSSWNADSNKHLTKKQLKKKKKAEEKARKANAQQEQQQPPAEQPPVTEPAEKAPEVIDPAKKDQEQKPQEPKPQDVKQEEPKAPEAKPEEKKEPEAKPEEKKEPEMSKKERKKKAKEEKKAQKEKEKQDKEEQDKKDKEAQDNKDK
jgi:hypothetical protein